MLPLHPQSFLSPGCLASPLLRVISIWGHATIALKLPEVYVNIVALKSERDTLKLKMCTPWAVRSSASTNLLKNLNSVVQTIQEEVPTKFAYLRLDETQIAYHVHHNIWILSMYVPSSRCLQGALPCMHGWDGSHLQHTFTKRVVEKQDFVDVDAMVVIKVVLLIQAWTRKQ